MRLLIESGAIRSASLGTALQTGQLGLRLYHSTKHVAWKTWLQSNSTTFSPLTSDMHTGQIVIFNKGTTSQMAGMSWGWRPRRDVFSGIVRDGVSFFEELGRGSYAVVYRGQLDGAEVALKLRDRPSLERENLVRIRAAIQADGIDLFPSSIALDNIILDGRELHLDAMTPCGRPLTGLTTEEARKAMLDVACAGAFLHSARWVHRDIKPDNIILTDRAMLTDFARSAEEGQWCSATTTPRYAAPEVIMRMEEWPWVQASVTHDRYSFGETVYELFCERPWEERIFKLVSRATSEVPTHRKSFKEAVELLS